MRDAERFADAARIVDILAGAAGTGAVNGGAMILKLQRNAEHIVTLLFEKAGDDG
jgi:hypothetical protein